MRPVTPPTRRAARILQRTEGMPGWMLPAATIGAVIASAVSVIAIAEARHRPIDSFQAAQFIGGCQSSAGATAVDCRCYLNQLEADGYDTLDALNHVVADARSEEAAGTIGPSRATLRNALLACRR